MKTFVIERDIPGLGSFSPEKLKEISRASNLAIEDLKKPYKWIKSYVTADKLYCIHSAESEDVIREHAKAGQFPISSINQVLGEIDPSTGA